jgi:hypothetical protein
MTGWVTLLRVPLSTAQAVQTAAHSASSGALRQVTQPRTDATALQQWRQKSREPSTASCACEYSVFCGVVGAPNTGQYLDRPDR